MSAKEKEKLEDSAQGGLAYYIKEMKTSLPPKERTKGSSRFPTPPRELALAFFLF